MKPYRIERLGDHDRSRFSCGEPALDEWFRERAGQDQRRNVAGVFVATDESGEVFGFYTLSTFTLVYNELPDRITRKLPRYVNVPALLIGRLARDVRARGERLGETLLGHAIEQALSVSATVGVFALAVEAKSPEAAAFYSRYGFEPFPGHPLRLFLPMSLAARAIEKL